MVEAILRPRPAPVTVQLERLIALLGIPDRPTGLLIFARCSGTGRLRPRIDEVAAALREAHRAAIRCLRADKELVIVPGVTRLIKGPATLDEVIRHAADWVVRRIEEL